MCERRHSSFYPKPPSQGQAYRRRGRAAGHHLPPSLLKHQLPLAGTTLRSKETCPELPHPLLGVMAGPVSIPILLPSLTMMTPNLTFRCLSPKSVPSSRQLRVPCLSLGPAMEPQDRPTSTTALCDSWGTCWPAGPDWSSVSKKLCLCVCHTSDPGTTTA